MTFLKTTILALGLVLTTATVAKAEIFNSKSLAKQQRTPEPKHDGFKRLREAKPGDKLYHALHGGQQGKSRLTGVDVQFQN